MEERRDAIVTSVSTALSVVDERVLKATILTHLRDGNLVHIIDLMQLQRVSTRLMNTLVGLFYATRQKNGLFALVISQPEVLRSFEIAGLDGIFPIFPDVAQAIQNTCLRKDINSYHASS